MLAFKYKIKLGHNKFLFQDSGTTVYRGSKRSCTKEFILVVDKDKKVLSIINAGRQIKVLLKSHLRGLNAEHTDKKHTDEHTDTDDRLMQNIHVHVLINYRNM